MQRLDPWQEEILKSQAHRILLCKGRQIGGTTIFAIKAAERLVSQKGCRIGVGSITEDQAKLVIVMIKNYLHEKYPTYLKVKKADKSTQDKIRLNNGSELRSRPVGNSGDAFRGFTFNIIYLNEASRWPPISLEAIKPTLLTTAGEIWMDSTPFGKEGYFYECWENRSKIWQVFNVSSEEVIFNRTITSEWTEERRAQAIQFLNNEKAEMSSLQYGQEYLGLFMEDLQRFISENLIKTRCISVRPDKIPPEPYKNYLGVDIARMGDDKSAFSIITDLTNGKFIQTESETTEKTLTTDTEVKIIQLAQKFNVKKVGLDAGAGTLGVSIMDHLLQSPIRHKLIALNNRSLSLSPDGKIKQRMAQEDMAQNFLSMLEHAELDLLKDDSVINSLRSLQYEFVKTPHQQTRMRIFSSNHSDSDVFEALKRAAWLAKKEKSLNLWAA